MQKESSPFNSAGFSLVEVILAGSVFVLTITAIATALFYGQAVRQISGQRVRAEFIADEALEAVRNIRDESFTNLVDGTYGLSTASGYWTLQSQPDTVGIYTRTLHITALDANTKYVDVTVTWPENSRLTGTVTLITYLSNFPKNETWITPVLGPCIDIQGGQNARKVDLSGNYAYFVTDSASQSFVSVNVANPNAPFTAGGTSLQNNPRNLQISGNTAYITSANNSQEMQVVDIANPVSPQYTAAFNPTGNGSGSGVAISGTTAYLVRDSGTEFYSVDISTPSAPTQKSSLVLGGGASEVFVLGQFAYVASQNDAQELQVVNISNPNSLSITGFLNLSGTSDALTIAGFGSTVAIGRANGEVNLIDVTTPAAPHLLSTFSAGGQVNDLSVGVSNTRLFAATSNSTKELQIIDITIPGTPSLRGSYNAQDVMNGVVYSPTQNVVYIAGSSNSRAFCSIKPL